jgi:hypothetical protein
VTVLAFNINPEGVPAVVPEAPTKPIDVFFRQAERSGNINGITVLPIRYEGVRARLYEHEFYSLPMTRRGAIVFGAYSTNNSRSPSPRTARRLQDRSG